MIRSHSQFDCSAIQQQFFSCLSKAHHNYANLDILSRLLFKYIESQTPNPDVSEADVRSYLVKVDLIRLK